MLFLPALALLAAVILVNGWTDAPNAIAAAVAAGTLSFPAAAAMAAVCNLLGVVCTAAVSTAVARTLCSIADFGPYALTALTAALAAVVLWAVLAWLWGIPTSESHALVSALTGAALALGARRLRLAPLLWVAVGMVLSLALGWAGGKAFSALLPRRRESFYKKGQVLGAALTAFLHGSQDGQKFLGVFALILALEPDRGSFPLWAPWACAILMALGTALGGRRIIETVGQRMVTLDPRSGFAAELGCAAVLTLCTLLGLPVSTTHAKASAILGAGASPNGRVAGELGAVWLFTFPGCAFLSFLLVKLLLM